MSVTKWPLCQVCGKSVATFQGAINISAKELTEFMKSLKEWEERHPRDESGGRMLDEAALVDYPQTVEWHWGHSYCLGDGLLMIEYKKFDTAEKALAWTIKMMENTWLDYTNWVGMIQKHHKLPEV